MSDWRDDPGSEPDRMTLGQAVRYLVSPVALDARAAVDAEGLRHLIVLFMTNVVVVMVVTAAIWSVLLSATGGEMPANANDSLLELNPGRLVLYAIVIAPLVEEGLFRSWLGGRRSAVVGLPVLAALMAVLLAAPDLPGMAVAGLAACLAFAVGVVVRKTFALDGQSVAAARATLFPAAFWGSAVLFALLHMTNYTDGTLALPLLLLAVLPQGLVGLVLGYVRMRFGLVSAIAFHAGYNALFISLMLLGAGLAEGAPAG